MVEVRSPEQLVEYAAKLRRQAADSFDEVWCVVDVDEFDIAKAIASARKAEVSLAVSDPCFELWLLLHFGDHSAHVAGAKAACSLLTKHLPDYDKTIDYPALHANLDAAIERAQALGPDNPATTVWKLVEAALNR